MKRKFKVAIGDRFYEVEVEEIGTEAEPAIKATQTSVSPVLERPTEPTAPPIVKKPEVKKVEGETVVTAPIPGVVRSIKCKVNSSVKAGDVLLVLEAMKMENEIYSPKAGVIKKILVTEGKNVSFGDPMIIIE
jgi:biotin carboxyl carrier protein